MRLIAVAGLAAALCGSAIPVAHAGDLLADIGENLRLIRTDYPPPPRRRLTTYMAHYPFGVLREDYTPLGAPGVSKRDYYGVPPATATLHVPARKAGPIGRRRTVVSTRY